MSGNNIKTCFYFCLQEKQCHPEKNFGYGNKITEEQLRQGFNKNYSVTSA